MFTIQASLRKGMVVKQKRTVNIKYKIITIEITLLREISNTD